MRGGPFSKNPTPPRPVSVEGRCISGTILGFQATLLRPGQPGRIETLLFSFHLSDRCYADRQ